MDEVLGWHRFLASGLLPVFAPLAPSVPSEGLLIEEGAEVAEGAEVDEVAEVAFGQEVILEEEIVAAEDPKEQADGGHRLGPH